MTDCQVGRFTILAAVAVVFALASPSEAAIPFRTTAAFILGNERSEAYYGSRLNLGVDLALAPRGWPAGIAFFATRSANVKDCETECGTVHEKMTQAGIGVRREWSARRVSPSIAGGLAWNEQRTDIDPAYDVVNTGYTQRGLGWWAGATVSLKLADPVHIGGGVRYSRMNQSERGYSYWYPLWSAYGSLGLTWPPG